jgi:hypothetical protein
VVNFGRRLHPFPGQNCTPVNNLTHDLAAHHHIVAAPKRYGLSGAGRHIEMQFHKWMLKIRLGMYLEEQLSFLWSRPEFGWVSQWDLHISPYTPLPRLNAFAAAESSSAGP